VSTRQRRVRELAARLETLRLARNADVSLLGFLAGTLHALDRADQLNYNPGRAKPDVKVFEAEFRRALKAIRRGVDRPRPWRAGFYFFSALMRLAALNERLDKRFGKQLDIAAAIRIEVNKLKHDLEVHPAAPLSVGFDGALRVASAMCDRMERGLR
jgi:hypothetical protein